MLGWISWLQRWPWPPLEDDEDVEKSSLSWKQRWRKSSSVSSMILIYSICIYIYIYIEREGAIWYHLDAKEGRTFVQPCFMTLEGYTMVYPRDTVSSCMHRFSSLHRSTLAHTKKKHHCTSTVSGLLILTVLLLKVTHCFMVKSWVVPLRTQGGFFHRLGPAGALPPGDSRHEDPAANGWTGPASGPRQPATRRNMVEDLRWEELWNG